MFDIIHDSLGIIRISKNYWFIICLIFNFAPNIAHPICVCNSAFFIPLFRITNFHHVKMVFIIAIFTYILTLYYSSWLLTYFGVSIEVLSDFNVLFLIFNAWRAYYLTIFYSSLSRIFSTCFIFPFWYGNRVSRVVFHDTWSCRQSTGLYAHSPPLHLLLFSTSNFS